MTQQIRLQRYLAQAGIAARRKAEVLITQGRVRVNGRVVDQLGAKVSPGEDSVVVDGRPIEVGQSVYLLVCKPRARVTAVNDPDGRPTLRSLLPIDLGPLHSVGRLSFNTEGAIVLTSDGSLVEALLHPKHAIAELYHVKLRGDVSDAELMRLRRGGLAIGDGEFSRPVQVKRLGFTGAHTWLELAVEDNRYRLVQRLAEALGHTTIKIARLEFAKIAVGDLRPGDYRALTDREIRRLRALAAGETLEEPEEDSADTKGSGRKGPGSKASGARSEAQGRKPERKLSAQRPGSAAPRDAARRPPPGREMPRARTDRKASGQGPQAGRESPRARATPARPTPARATPARPTPEKKAPGQKLNKRR